MTSEERKRAEDLKRYAKALLEVLDNGEVYRRTNVSSRVHKIARGVYRNKQFWSVEWAFDEVMKRAKLDKTNLVHVIAAARCIRHIY